MASPYPNAVCVIVEHHDGPRLAYYEKKEYDPSEHGEPYIPSDEEVSAGKPLPKKENQKGDQKSIKPPKAGSPSVVPQTGEQPQGGTNEKAHEGNQESHKEDGKVA